MNLPGVEKYIAQKGINVAAATAFIGIGAVAVASSIGPAGLALLGFALPVAFDALAMKVLVSDSKGFKGGPSLYEPFFKSSMKKWITKYLENSDNLTEKKYKVICLNLWMRHKRIGLDKIINLGDDLFEKLTDDLIQAKESNYPLDLIFNNQTQKIFGEKIAAETFLNEDKDNPEKIAIAKKVYQEYANSGITAKAFISQYNPTTYLFLQDYKFSSEDYNVIKDYIKKLEKKGKDNTLFYDTESNKTNQTMKEVIGLENNIDNLKALEKYYRKTLEINGYNDSKSIEEIIKGLEVKISYLELGGQIPEKNNEFTPTIKQKKKI